MKKFILILLSTIIAAGLAACSGEPAEPDKSSPEREVLHEDGNHSFDGKTCTECGYIDMSGMEIDAAIAQYGYFHVDTDGSNTVNTGDTVYFGSYPKTRVDEDLSAYLMGSWTDYGYYANMEKAELMSYMDFTVDEVKYRAVKIDGNKPYYTDLAATEEKSYVAQNGYTAGNVYFFKFEPIEWRVLDYANGEAMLNTVRCVDGQSYKAVYFKDGSVYYGDEAKTVYANDWENSDIRAFLNGSFTDWAFDSAERALLVTKTLDNTASYDPENTFAKDQKVTDDKVYLLSWADLNNELYGFTGSLIKTGTDYAESQGLRTSQQSANENGESASWWSLRSSGGKSFTICGVNKYGEATKSNTTMYSDSATDGVVTYTAEGISPVVNIKIGK